MASFRIADIFASPPTLFSKPDCVYCQEAFGQIEKMSKMLKNIIRQADVTKIRYPPSVTHIPTLILTDSTGNQQVFSGLDNTMDALHHVNNLMISFYADLKAFLAATKLELTSSQQPPQQPQQQRQPQQPQQQRQPQQQPQDRFSRNAVPPGRGAGRNLNFDEGTMIEFIEVEPRKTQDQKSCMVDDTDPYGDQDVGQTVSNGSKSLQIPTDYKIKFLNN